MVQIETSRIKGRIVTLRLKEEVRGKALIRLLRWSQVKTK